MRGRDAQVRASGDAATARDIKRDFCSVIEGWGFGSAGTGHATVEGREEKGEGYCARVIAKEGTEGFGSSGAKGRSGTDTGNKHALP